MRTPLTKTASENKKEKLLWKCHLVSIIVPVYNAQSHLSRCLESICGQEYKNLELIVINDGSKDKSLPVCEEFRKKDSRILLVDKANSGVSDTRNLGLKLAGGKYVQFVDSDDYIAPDYTARLVEAAEKTGADLVISPYTMVIPAGVSKPEQVLEKIQDDLGVMHVARPPENREYGFLPEGVYDKDTFARRLMDKPASYFYSVLWNKLYRRDILTRHDIRFTSEMRWAEDLVFNMQYIQYAEVFASIPQPGYYYVQNPQSICHTQIKPATLVQNKIQVFHYYKDLYTRLGMYEQVRPQLYKFLIDIARALTPPAPSRRSSTRRRLLERAQGRDLILKKSGRPLRGLPLFYLRSDGGTLLSQPVALVLGQAGSQLLEDLAVVGVQPIQLVAAQTPGTMGEVAMGTNVMGRNARNSPYWLDALW